MLKKERQAYILHQVNLHNKVLSSSLCTEIKVSEDTIRRDLQELAEEGKVIKVHGGALSHSFNDVSLPLNGVYSQNQKKTIAQKAISLINNGMFVLTSGGTTIMELARSLPPQLKATFISGSIPVILCLFQELILGFLLAQHITFLRFGILHQHSRRFLILVELLTGYNDRGLILLPLPPDHSHI